MSLTVSSLWFWSPQLWNIPPLITSDTWSEPLLWHLPFDFWGCELVCIVLYYKAAFLQAGSISYPTLYPQWPLTQSLAQSMWWESPLPRAGLRTVIVWCRWACAVRGCPAYCRMFTSILATAYVHPVPQVVATRSFSRHCPVSRGRTRGRQNQSWLRATRNWDI